MSVAVGLAARVADGVGVAVGAGGWVALGVKVSGGTAVAVLVAVLVAGIVAEEVPDGVGVIVFVGVFVMVGVGVFVIVGVGVRVGGMNWVGVNWKVPVAGPGVNVGSWVKDVAEGNTKAVWVSSGTRMLPPGVSGLTTPVVPAGGGALVGWGARASAMKPAQ